MPNISIVAVSGSLHSPSKTTVLAREILEGFATALRSGQGDDLEVDTHLIELSDIGREFSGALSRSDLSPIAEEALRDRIEQAISRGLPVVRSTVLPVSEYVATW